jgi:hypothetical protein
LKHFGLNLQEEKSRLIEFGRYAEENAKNCGGKPATFDFLGFTHYCSKSSKGWFRVKRKTSRKKFRKKLKEMNILQKNNLKGGKREQRTISKADQLFVKEVRSPSKKRGFFG